MRKATILFASAVAAGLGTASAEVALNEAQMDGITAGGFNTYVTNHTKTIDIRVDIAKAKLADYRVSTFVTNGSADAEAAADAYGPNADAETYTTAQAVYVPDFYKAGCPTGCTPADAAYVVQAYSQSTALVDRTLPTGPD